MWVVQLAWSLKFGAQVQMPINGKSHMRRTFFPKELDIGIIVACFFYSGFFLSFQTNSKRLSSDFGVDKRLYFWSIFSFKSFLLDFFESNLADGYHICRFPSIDEWSRFEISDLSGNTHCITKRKVCSYHKCII